MKTKIIIVALNVLALSAFASPETHRAKAEELMRVQTKNQDLAKLLDSKISDITKKMAAKGAPKEAIQETQEAIRQYVSSHVDAKQLETKMVERYMSKFSEEEIGKLLETIKDPLLQRLKEETGTLKKELMAEYDAALKTDAAELNQQLQAIAKKYRLK